MATTSAQALSALIKPPIFKGERDKFISWKMKFMTFLGTTGCSVALVEAFDKSLPAQEDTSALDATDPAEKAQINAVKANAMAMQAIIMALDRDDDMSIVIAVSQREAKVWPSGKAWKVWKRIEDEYQPSDTTSKVEMQRALRAIELEEDENPKTLLTKMARIEATFRTVLTEDEERDIVWRCASGMKYGAIMLMTDRQSKATSGDAATAEELCEAMYEQYRIDLQTVRGKVPAGAGETALSATAKSPKSFGGKCFECNEVGHRKSDCPNKGKGEKATAAVGGGKKERYNGNCGFCDKKGHREADCWKKFPEKMPKKKTTEEASAVTMDELLVGSVDFDINDFDIDEETFCQMCAETEITAEDLDEDVDDEVWAREVFESGLLGGDKVLESDLLGGDNALKFLEDRLRAYVPIQRQLSTER